MCGRFAQFHCRDEFLTALALDTPVSTAGDWHARYNVAPGTPVSVFHHHDDQLQLTLVNWGYAPEWWREQGKPPLINARVETAEHSRMFAPLWKHGRALVPASGWYEWKKSTENPIQRKKNLSSRTWFEHMLAELTSPQIDSRTLAECQGLLQFFFDNGDDMVKRYRQDNEWFELQDLDTYSVADRLIQRMLREDVTSTNKFLTAQLQLGKAWYWGAEYVRHLLWQHGIVGDRTGHQLEEWMERSNVVILQKTMGKRLNSPAITKQLAAFPLLNRYIWAWRDISGIQAVRKWVDRQVKKDEAFLSVLLQLRYHGFSSAHGYYQALPLTNMTEYLGETQKVLARIEHIKQAGKFAEQVKQVEQSISRSR